MNIVLIGFMGSGKSTVGRQLARQIGYQFVDTDQEVERLTGMTIKDIFAQYGESFFRQLEAKTIEAMLTRQNIVLATGGGVVLDKKNVKNLRLIGKLFYLFATPERLAARIEHDSGIRPLLATENRMMTIAKMLKEREIYYQCADYVIDTSDLSVAEVVAQIINLMGDL